MHNTDQWPKIIPHDTRDMEPPACVSNMYIEHSDNCQKLWDMILHKCSQGVQEYSVCERLWFQRDLTVEKNAMRTY